MRKISYEIVWKLKNKRFIWNKYFPKIVGVYETVWKNTVEPDGTQTTT